MPRANRQFFLNHFYHYFLETLDILPLPDECVAVGRCMWVWLGLFLLDHPVLVLKIHMETNYISVVIDQVTTLLVCDTVKIQLVTLGTVTTDPTSQTCQMNVRKCNERGTVAVRTFRPS